MTVDDLLTTPSPTDLGPANLRRVWGNFATGVAVITAHDGTAPLGFTCQSVVSVSLDPPLVSFCPARSSTSWPGIRAVGTFCVNILADDQLGPARQFARSGADKFAGLEWTMSPIGAPALTGTLASVDARLTDEHDAGDHTIVVAEITGITADHERAPLVFFRGGFSTIGV